MAVPESWDLDPGSLRKEVNLVQVWFQTIFMSYSDHLNTLSGMALRDTEEERAQAAERAVDQRNTKYEWASEEGILSHRVGQVTEGFWRREYLEGQAKI